LIKEIEAGDGLIPCFAAVFCLGPAGSNKAEKRALLWAKPLGLDQSNRYNCDCPIRKPPYKVQKTNPGETGVA
jgi:hypothetical protein